MGCLRCSRFPRRREVFRDAIAGHVSIKPRGEIQRAPGTVYSHSELACERLVSILLVQLLSTSLLVLSASFAFAPNTSCHHDAPVALLLLSDALPSSRDYHSNTWTP